MLSGRLFKGLLDISKPYSVSSKINFSENLSRLHSLRHRVWISVKSLVAILRKLSFRRFCKE
jgi:hypothetical protein